MLRELKGKSSKDAIALVQNRAVTGDREFADLEQDIILSQDFLGAGDRKQTVHASAEIVIHKFEHATVGGVLQGHNANARLWYAVIMAIGNVLQKMLNDRWRNKETGVLQTWHALEGNPNNKVILNHRTAAVTRIDGGVRLNTDE